MTTEPARAFKDEEEPLSPALVFRQHAADVGRWARRLGGPSIDVEEVVQEVFVRVWEKLPAFRGESQLTTWLFRITANEVARRRRARGLWARFFEQESERTEQVAAPACTAAETLERDEDIARLYRALDRLGEKYRTPLVLFEIEELSGAKISELLGIPVATVWVRLHRAREQLAKALVELQEVAR